MPVNGFDDAKNKVSVHTTVEVEAMNNAKQDQHIATTVILTAAGWNSFYQEVTVNGVTANNTVIVSPVPAIYNLYTDLKIHCVYQNDNVLGFAYDMGSSAPTTDIVVNVLILGV